MKKVHAVLLFGLSLLFFGCYSRDDDYFDKIVRLSISDAVVFDNQENYNVGDTLIFELRFSRYLDEAGFSNKLDVFETSNSEEFGYSFGISKFSDFSNNFESVNIDEEFILGTRSANYSYFGYGYSNANMAALLNENQEEYISKVGIVLVETGRFQLDFERVTLSTGYDFDTIGVEIEHLLSAESTLNTEFTVNE